MGCVRLVRVCLDGDDQGMRAAERLALDVAACGIEVLVEPVPTGAHLLDLYRVGGPYGVPGPPSEVFGRYAAAEAVTHGV